MDTTLQVPITKSLKAAATEEALKQGFSSLQEAVRVFLAKLVGRNLTFSISEQFPDEILTDRQSKVLEKKYNEAMFAIKHGVKGKDYFEAHSVKEMMAYLDS